MYLDHRPGNPFARQFGAMLCEIRAVPYWNRYRELVEAVQSPIEEALLAALLYEQWTCRSGERLCMCDTTGLEWNVDYAGMAFRFSPRSILGYTQADVGPYRADFLFQSWLGGQSRSFVVECDGHDFHERTKKQAARDRTRDRWMIAQGITVLRFTGSEIWASPEKCASDILQTIRGHADLGVSGLSLPERAGHVWNEAERRCADWSGPDTTENRSARTRAIAEMDARQSELDAELDAARQAEPDARGGPAAPTL